MPQMILQSQPWIRIIQENKLAENSTEVSESIRVHKTSLKPLTKTTRKVNLNCHNAAAAEAVTENSLDILQESQNETAKIILGQT